MNDALAQHMLIQLMHKIKKAERKKRVQNTKWAKRALNFQQRFKIVYKIALFLFIILPIFKKPRWCIEKFGHDKAPT